MADVPDPAPALPLVQAQFSTTPGGDRVTDPDPIVAFLTERLDDDEQVALHVGPEQGDWSLDLLDGDWHIAISARRVLADVEAKRAILTEYVEAKRAVVDLADMDWTEETPDRTATSQSLYNARKAVLAAVVKRLVQPFRDHPDFDPSWAS